MFCKVCQCNQKTDDPNRGDFICKENGEYYFYSKIEQIQCPRGHSLIKPSLVTNKPKPVNVTNICSICVHKRLITDESEEVFCELLSKETKKIYCPDFVDENTAGGTSYGTIKNEDVGISDIPVNTPKSVVKDIDIFDTSTIEDPALKSKVAQFKEMAKLLQEEIINEKRIKLIKEILDKKANAVAVKFMNAKKDDLEIISGIKYSEVLDYCNRENREEYTKYLLFGYLLK